MKFSLFRTGLVPRLIAAVSFGVLAFGAVAVLEPQDPTDAPPARPAPASPSAGHGAAPWAASATLYIESVQPVATWSVQLGGVTLSPRSVTPTGWLGEIAAASSAGLVVDAEAGTDTAPVPNALRIRIAGTTPSRDQTFWCARVWSVVTRVSDLAIPAVPIDPTDLP